MAQKQFHEETIGNQPVEESVSDVLNDSIQGILIEKDFYEKLINIAADSFANASFSTIQAQLINVLNKAESVEKLVKLSQIFIDERAFIDKVVSEKQRIEYAKL